MMREKKNEGTTVSKSNFRFPFPNDETSDWYRLTPVERFEESQKLWEVFMLLGGNLEPEPDSQSPFNFFEIQG
jgi:hypothetical protein